MTAAVHAAPLKNADETGSQHGQRGAANGANHVQSVDGIERKSDRPTCPTGSVGTCVRGAV